MPTCTGIQALQFLNNRTIAAHRSVKALRRSALEAERTSPMNPDAPSQISWVEHCLSYTQGPIVAATDYLRILPELIRTWVPRRYITLGTDGLAGK